MKKYSLNIAAALAIVTTLFFTSCTKDEPTPTQENNQEEITAITVSYVKLHTDGTPMTDTASVTFDANGTPTPGTLSLSNGSSYLTLVTFYDHDEVLNSEIVEEGTEHKIFFFPSQSGIINYEYNDHDSNGNPIGLSGKTTILNPGTISLNLILRHGLNKNSSAAQGWNNTDYIQAGGEDDANVSFNIQAD